MMTLKSIILIVGILFVLHMLAACESIDHIRYEHVPSKRFYHKLDISAAELEPFIDDDILFVVNLKDVEVIPSYSVRQFLFTNKKNKDKQVKIKRAVIQGGDWKEEVIIEQIVAVDKSIDWPELFRQGSVKLFQIKGDLLESAYHAGGYLRLKIFYEMGGKVKFHEYELERRVESYPKILLVQ